MKAVSIETAFIYILIRYKMHHLHMEDELVHSRCLNTKTGNGSKNNYHGGIFIPVHDAVRWFSKAFVL